MSTLPASGLVYGNWIRRRILIALAIATCIAALLVLLPFGPIYRVVMLVLFFALLLSFGFPAYAYWMFSPRGGHFQEKVWSTVAEGLGPVPGATVVDIGAGSGILAIIVARRNEGAHVVGVDYWGRDWEYSQAVCEANAAAAGLDERVRFQQGDAAALAFDDGAFDAAVSNLTFHEVKSADDKRAVVVEALRVVRKGGRFSFIDYFYEAAYYGPTADFAAFLSGLQLANVSIHPLRETLDIPLLLRHPKAFGRVGIVTGTK